MQKFQSSPWAYFISLKFFFLFACFVLFFINQLQYRIKSSRFFKDFLQLILENEMTVLWSQHTLSNLWAGPVCLRLLLWSFLYWGPKRPDATTSHKADLMIHTVHNSSLGKGQSIVIHFWPWGKGLLLFFFLSLQWNIMAMCLPAEEERAISKQNDLSFSIYSCLFGLFYIPLQPAISPI